MEIEILRQLALNNKNFDDLKMAISQYGRNIDLHRPEVLVHFLAQIFHETLSLKYTEEIWGGSKAQLSYQGRMGNVNPGDGFKFRGRGFIQLTGRNNYTNFNRWFHQRVSSSNDFTKDPDKVLLFPANALTAFWYWDVNNITKYAKANDIERITKIINGGLNGFEDRKNKYTTIGLLLLGYKKNEVMQFQKDNDLEVDGIAGPLTRQAIHEKLKVLDKKEIIIDDNQDDIKKTNSLLKKIIELLKLIMEIFKNGK